MKTGFITAIIAIAALFLLGLTSCTGGYVNAEIGYFKPASPIDPAAKFGVLSTKGDKIDIPIVTPQK